MARLYISPDSKLEMAEGDHLSCGSLHNEGEVSGEGSLGLDWTEPIEGDSEGVTCPIVEENTPSLEVSGKTTATTIEVSCEDIGAETYYSALDGKPKEEMPENLVKEYTGLEPYSRHYVHITAENSRGSLITGFYTFTTGSGAAIYKVVQDVFTQQGAGLHGQNCAFMARILNYENLVPIRASQIESITMNVYRLIRNVDGVAREEIKGMVGVSVGTGAIYDEIRQSPLWTRDSGGYNFFHVPNQRGGYLFPEPGAYQVEYEIIFVTENPIKLVYELYAS